MGTTPDRLYGRELATEPEVDAKLAAHRDATLLHELDRPGALEVLRDANGRVQLVRVRDGAAGPSVRETEILRDAAGRVSSVVVRQFEPPGILARTRVLSLSRDAGGRVSGGTVTVS